MFWTIEQAPHQTKSDVRRALKEASRHLGRHICFGGKGSAPPPPDYTGAANATAAGNLDAARAGAAANRVNQYTPFGSLTFSQTPTKTLDAKAYEEAFQAWNTNGRTGAEPSAADYMSFNPDAGWSATQTLSPDQQKLLDADTRTKLGLSNLADTGLSYVKDTLSKPFDMSGVPQVKTSVAERGFAGPVNVGGNYRTGVDAGNLDAVRQQAQDSVYRRQTSMLDPQYQRQQEALESQLANQGLARGSEAYTKAMDDFSRQRDFAYGQARDASITQGNQFAQEQFQRGLANAGLENTARERLFSEGFQNAGLTNLGAEKSFAQGLANANLTNSSIQQLLQQQSFLRNEPLNMLNAVRTGSQVTMPQFTSVAQQSTAPGADLLRATESEYNGQLGALNAKNAQTASTNSTIGALAMAAAMAFSDRRLKRNIVKLGVAPNGLNVYSFDYVWGESAIGHMADEVEVMYPEAVVTHESGFKMVNYAKLGA